MQKRVLLLLPTTTYRAHDFVAAAERLGVQAVIGSDQKQTLEELVPGQMLALPLSDAGASAVLILRFASRFPIDAIIPTDEETAEVAATAAAALGLPHNPPEAARATRYKHLLRDKLTAAGVRTPRYRVLIIETNPEAQAEQEKYPCVLKPVFLSASRGVIRANDAGEFVAAFARIKKILSNPELRKRGGGAPQLLLSEEYIPGEEVALEGLLSNGRLRTLALFDKPDPLVGPFFEETIYVTPSRLPVDVQRAISRVTEDAARAIGLCEGPIHAELRVDEVGPCLLELAARSIGGLCSRSLRFGTGLSLEELTLKHAIGDSVDDLERESLAAGVMMIPVPRAGTLREVGGLDVARAVPGIEDVTISIPIGGTVVPLPEGSSYLGFIFARGETPEVVEEALREADRKLGFRIEESAG